MSVLLHTEYLYTISHLIFTAIQSVSRKLNCSLQWIKELEEGRVGGQALHPSCSLFPVVFSPSPFRYGGGDQNA